MELAVVAEDIEKVIVTESQIQTRVKELATIIEKEYEGTLWKLQASPPSTENGDGFHHE